MQGRSPSLRSQACDLIALFACAGLACSASKNVIGNPDSGSDAGADAGPVGDGGSPPDGGCTLDSAAFCDTFEEGPSTGANRGRAGDLDASKWSVGRLSPQQVNAPTKANPAPPAPIPACKASLAKSSVYPDEDTLICDASSLRSHELMTAVAMQNYGLNSYRIRQPFDFAGRTGKIVFDVDAVMADGPGVAASSWVSVEITEDPIPTAGFATPERGTLPKNGVEIHLNNDHCPQGFEKGISVGQVDVYTDYAHADATPIYPASWNSPDCVATAQGALNHFEIDLSQTAITVYGSDPSPDGGKTYPNFHKIAAATYSLPFTRGWVHMTARNHATVKYGFGPDWVYHWDNIGFDGPVITNWREYAIADSLTTSGTDVNVGYILRDGTGSAAAGIYTCCPETNVPHLSFTGVDLTNVTSAKLALTSFYLVAAGFGAPADLTTMSLRYRFNGGTWRDRFITTEEAAQLLTPNFQLGDLAQIIEVPLGDLQTGTNTLELTTSKVPQAYPNVVSNIDLILMVNQ